MEVPLLVCIAPRSRGRSITAQVWAQGTWSAHTQLRPPANLECNRERPSNRRRKPPIRWCRGKNNAAQNLAPGRGFFPPQKGTTTGRRVKFPPGKSGNLG